MDRESPEEPPLSTARRRFGGVLLALAIGWAALVIATFGSAEEWYFRGCTGSCLASMPPSYATRHQVVVMAFIVVPWAIAGVLWWLSGPTGLARDDSDLEAP